MLQSTMQMLPSTRATRECYNDRCFRIHLKGTRRKQTPPATQEPSTTPRTTNQQQAMIKTQNLAYNRPPPLLKIPTQRTTATHPAPSPTQYNTPPAMQYLTTHQTTVKLYRNPPPLHAIPYTTSPSSTPILSSCLNICTRTTNTFSCFSPHRHPTSIPAPHTSIHRMGPANAIKGHNCE